MKRGVLPPLLACLLGLAAFPAAGQPARPRKQVALTVVAYSDKGLLPYGKTKDDYLAPETAWTFFNGPRDLTRQLARQGWDARLWRSSRTGEQPPPADEAPTEANLRGYLKGLAALGPSDEAVV